MEVRIQINDEIYTSLLNGTTRIEGSIGLVSPTEGNFNAYRRYRPKPDTRYMKLPHGRVTVTEEMVRMQLLIKRDEYIIPTQAIETESNLAINFVQFMEELV